MQCSLFQKQSDGSFFFFHDLKTAVTLRKMLSGLSFPQKSLQKLFLWSGMDVGAQYQLAVLDDGTESSLYEEVLKTDLHNTNTITDIRL